MLPRPEPKPRYYAVSGNIVFPQSLRIERGRITHFFFEGDRRVIEKFCTEWFNRTSRGRLRLKPISNTVILSYHNVTCTLGNCAGFREKREVCQENECSIAFLRNDKGELLAGLKYNEVSFNILVQDRNGRVFSFSPFRLIDDGIAMANYREAFGFPDAFGEIRHLGQSVGTPTDADPPAPYCVQRDCECRKQGTWLCAKSHLPQVDDDAMVESNLNFSYPSTRLFWIEKQASDLRGSQKVWGRQQEVAAQLPDLLAETLTQENIPTTHRTKCYHLADTVTLGGSRISLLQYRKSIGGPDAFYQAALTFKATAAKIYGGGTYPEKYTLNFWDKDGTYLNDLALARDFGLTTPESRVAKTVVWTDVDYELEPDSYLWVNQNNSE